MEHLSYCTVSEITQKQHKWDDEPVPLLVFLVNKVYILTLCSNHGHRANTAAAHLVADRSLCYMPGRPQGIDTARGWSSMNRREYLWIEGKKVNFYTLLSFLSNFY